MQSVRPRREKSDILDQDWEAELFMRMYSEHGI